MQRKLIRLSDSTSVISLPSKWVRSNNLKKGDSINIDEKENMLLVSKEEKKDKKQITIDVKSLSGKLLWTTVDAAYISGYDEIILLTKDHTQSDLMTKIATFFPGIMITEQRNNVVHMVDLASGKDEKTEAVEKIIGRVYMIIYSMIEDSINAARSKDWDVLLSMKKRDYHINSYVSYCFRQLNKYGYKNYAKLGIVHTYIKMIEIFADRLSEHIIHLGNQSSKSDKKFSQEKTNKNSISDLLIILKIIDLLNRNHSKYDMQKLSEIDNIKETVNNEILKSTIFDIEELQMQLFK